MNSTAQPSKVEIRKNAGAYQFYVNGQLFPIKGVGVGGRSGDRLDALHHAGGNAIRTWSTRGGRELLDTAKKYQLMVAMGLGMEKELHGFDYQDEAAVGRQFENLKKEILKYKDHPNLLCWIAGNELNLLFDENGARIQVNSKVWMALTDIVDFIHEVDPYHPVTTAFAGVSKQDIDAALEHCPQLDFLALQVYGDLAIMPDLVRQAQITKPFLITEFGPTGHWERPSTPWGREIEEPSSVKATGIMDRIHRGITSDPTGLCLGGFAFIWGQKQERTPTWYGMFIKTGEATATVDELTKFWTGTYPANRAPVVDSMRVDNKRAESSIILKAAAPCEATIYAREPDGDPMRFEWIILEEVKARSQGGAYEKEPEPVKFEITDHENETIRFIAPGKEGDYRLFAYVYDGLGKVGYANVPFRVQ